MKRHLLTFLLVVILGGYQSSFGSWEYEGLAGQNLEGFSTPNHLELGSLFALSPDGGYRFSAGQWLELNSVPPGGLYPSAICSAPFPHFARTLLGHQDPDGTAYLLAQDALFAEWDTLATYTQSVLTRFETGWAGGNTDFWGVLGHSGQPDDLIFSSDYGETWSMVSRPDVADISALFSDYSPNRVLVAGDGQVASSTNDGQSWLPVDWDLAGQSITGFGSVMLDMSLTGEARSLVPEIPVLTAAGVWAIPESGTPYQIFNEPCQEFSTVVGSGPDGFFFTRLAGLTATGQVWTASAPDYLWREISGSLPQGAQAVSLTYFQGTLRVATSGDGVFRWVPEISAVPEARAGLFQAVPNPFNGATRLSFEMPRPGQIVIRIYDVSGHLVHRVNRFVGQGEQTILWDSGALPSGVYLARMISDFQIGTTRLTLIK